MIGRTVGHYRILERLGAGGMGVVYKAEDTTLGRMVALKFLPPELMRDADAKSRFLREARAASLLDHNNICTIYDVGDTEDEQTFIAMACYDGETLERRIERGPLEVDEALKITQQIARGLSKAHASGIVHRDIKPANVIVTNDGVAKILDFGLAKLAGARPLTQANATLGTLAYMAPEQLRGEAVGPAADIWAMGIVLFELLTGQRPFRGDYQQAIAYSILNEQPVSLLELCGHAPAELEGIVSKLLCKDPLQRYQTARDVITELETLSSGLPDSAPSESSSELPVADRQPGARPRHVRALAVLLALSCVAFVIRFGMRGPPPGGVPAAAPSRPQPAGTQALVAHPNSIAVLPFENLGASEDAYFAAGMTDELIGRLAAVKSLRVLSRTSVVEYDRHGKTARQIGRDLGVAYIIEGTVQWEKRRQGDRVRVAPRLIRASDDTHLWSDRFDRELESVFDIQSEIGKKVAEELGVTLMQEEQQAIRARPTRNMEAYDLFLQANAASGDATYWTTEWRRGVALYEKATRLDPEFVAAHAGLGKAHLVIYHFGQDRRPERLVLARTSIDRALALDANSPEAHTALAYHYYWGFLDYPGALSELAIARRLRPNSEEVVLAMGFIDRRRGQFDQCLAYLNEARELNPRDGHIHSQIGITQQILRRHAEADRSFAHAIAIDPENSHFRRNQLSNRIAWQGKASDLSLLVVPLENREDMEATWGRFEWAILSRDYTRAVSILEESRVAHFAISRHYGAASRQPRELLLARAYALAGNREGATKSFEAARATLETWLKEQPDDPRMLSALALAEAGLGRSREAVEHAERSVELYPISEDAFLGACRLEELAEVYAAVGESAKAIKIIEQLVLVPSKLTVRLLEIDPTWDSLRENPRFKRIIAAGGKT
jgi:eukaryotic-like serine/threonine-protein kinase